MRHVLVGFLAAIMWVSTGTPAHAITSYLWEGETSAQHTNCHTGALGARCETYNILTENDVDTWANLGAAWSITLPPLTGGGSYGASLETNIAQPGNYSAYIIWFYSPSGGPTETWVRMYFYIPTGFQAPDWGADPGFKFLRIMHNKGNGNSGVATSADALLLLGADSGVLKFKSSTKATTWPTLWPAGGISFDTWHYVEVHLDINFAGNDTMEAWLDHDPNTTSPDYSKTDVDAFAAAATVTNAENNGSGLIRITTSLSGSLWLGAGTGDSVTISGVTGTTEANGTWTVTKINDNTHDLQGSTFTNAYVSGGTAINNSIGFSEIVVNENWSAGAPATQAYFADGFAMSSTGIIGDTYGLLTPFTPTYYGRVGTLFPKQ